MQFDTKKFLFKCFERFSLYNYIKILWQIYLGIGFIIKFKTLYNYGNKRVKIFNIAYVCACVSLENLFFLIIKILKLFYDALSTKN